MSYPPRFLALSVLMSLAFTALVCTPGLAEDSTLITVGPRFGFSGKTPFLGRQQKYSFNLYDIAALWRLPWQWPLGDTDWKLETRLMTSAGALEGAGETGLMATLVPDLAFSGWNGLVSLDAGAGAGFFPGTNLARKISAVRCKSSRLLGSGSTHWLMRMRGFVSSTSPTHESMGRARSAWTCIWWNSGTAFDANRDRTNWSIFFGEDFLHHFPRQYGHRHKRIKTSGLWSK
jgi:hypothetical protein